MLELDTLHISFSIFLYCSPIGRKKEKSVKTTSVLVVKNQLVVKNGVERKNLWTEDSDSSVIL